MISEPELQIKVEKIVERYMRDKRPSRVFVPEEFETIDKEFQKNKLLEQLILQFSSLLDNKADDIQQQVKLLYDERLSQQLDLMRNELASVKQMVIKSWQDMNVARSSSRNNSQVDFEQSSDSIGEDKPYKDIQKKIKDLEESTKRKVQSIENHMNILMDLQIQTKSQLGYLMEQKQDNKQDYMKLQDQIMPNLLISIEEVFEKKINIMNKNLQDLENKDNDKFKLQWTVIDEQSEILKQLQKEFDTLTNKKVQGRFLGIFSRSNQPPG